MKKNGGFSLVELIIVIAIMAVMIGLLAPQYVKYVEKSRKAKDDKLASELAELANVIASDEDYFSMINENDYIKFDATGVYSNNTALEEDILPEYISGWESAKIVSNEYKDMCYTVQFVANADDYKIAIQVGWN